MPAIPVPAIPVPAILVPAILVLGATGAAAQTVAPLPASDYTARPACRAPAPGHAGCLAVELVGRTAEARAHTHPLGMTRARPLAGTGPQEGYYGLRPADLRAAYFPGEAPEAPAEAPQTIALVDAYNDPRAAADLASYDKEFGIEPCTEASGCFAQVNQSGVPTNLPFPKSEAEREEKLKVCEHAKEGRGRQEACALVEEAEGWAVEISTDIEMASAICQRHCHIVLVEASGDSYEDLEAAEDTAVRLGHEHEASPPCASEACDTEVSNSWGGEEQALDSAAFDHPGTVITASAGDEGYLNWTEAAEAKAAGESYYSGADYPASSPHVVAVGGTSLTLSGGAYRSESVWNDDTNGGEENYGAGGGGCSTWFAAPEWQANVPDWGSVGCGTGASAKRAVADVAADADPYTGVAVYDSVPDFHEEEVGGKLEVVNTPLGWWPIGGTSVASPIVASMYALAGGSNGVEYPAKTLYQHLGTGLLHTVTTGGNGECDDIYATCSGSMEPLSARFAFDCGKATLICNAAPGYNGPAGVGTPDGIGALEPLSEAERKAVEEKHAEEATKRSEAEAAAKLKAEEEAKHKAEQERAEKEGSGGSGGSPGESPSGEQSAGGEQDGNSGGGGDSGSGGAQTGGSSSGGGSGSGGSGTGTSPNIAGGGPSATQSGTSSGSGSNGVNTGDHRPGAGGGVPHLSHLVLTARASAVFARGLPTLAQVAFSFTLSAPAHVRVTLARREAVGGRPRWAAVTGGVTLSVGGGVHRAHLHGGGTLPPGRYRLTLTPGRGVARSLTFGLL